MAVAIVVSKGAVLVVGGGRDMDGIDGVAKFLWPVASSLDNFWWCRW